MDGQAMKAWREKAGWRQPKLAEYLKVTWDKVRNWETGRTPIPNDVAATLDAMDIASPIFTKNEIGPSRLDSRGEPTTVELCDRLPISAIFYAFPWKDPAGHLWYGTRQRRFHNGIVQTFAVDVCLNATTWRHWWDMRPVDAAFMAKTIATLDARVAHHRTGNEPPAFYNSAMEDLSKPLAADIRLD